MTLGAARCLLAACPVLTKEGRGMCRATLGPGQHSTGSATGLQQSVGSSLGVQHSQGSAHSDASYDSTEALIGSTPQHLSADVLQALSAQGALGQDHLQLMRSGHSGSSAHSMPASVASASYPPVQAPDFGALAAQGVPMEAHGARGSLPRHVARSRMGPAGSHAAHDAAGHPLPDRV